MKYLGQIILDILKQNKKLRIFLPFFILVLINSCKDEKKCDENTSIAFINFEAQKPVEEIKIYKLQKKALTDSLIFSAKELKNPIRQNGKYYSVELNENYKGLDTIKIIVNDKQFNVEGIKFGKTPVSTNQAKDGLCEIQEYYINGQLIKNHAIIINIDHN